VKPVLFVTNYAPPARVGAFRALAEREDVEFALFGGRVHHGGVESQSPRLKGSDPYPPPRLKGSDPYLRVAQRDVFGLAASGDYRAVVAGTVGRTALPAAYLGARRARVPFVLWATLWAQPKGPAGLLGYPPLRWIYARADAVATYGPHVSAYVRARGARHVHEAPKAVDAAFWSAPAGPEAAAERRAPFQVLFAGRMLREKGVRVLLSAYRMTGLQAPDAALILVGDGPEASRAAPAGSFLMGARSPAEVRNFYAASDVVVLPSIRTRTFREPWGMVVNEAMHQGLPVIATDAVGAAAGGLLRDGRNLHDDPAERARLAEAARADVAPYTHAAWAEAMSRALADASGARAGGDW
jgi:glycosyltransferase involved in cell wall biosynthesis